MRIALLGYGKMGKAIEEIAIAKGHQIVLKVSRETNYDLSTIDVAIDFSIPEMAVTHLTNCLEAGVPVVSGTTGWLKDYDKITTLCDTKKGAFLYASNFSVGVNIFFELNKRLAELMAPLSEYNVSLEEIHHTQKLDAPSGTAITLAEGIISNTTNEKWELMEKESDNAFAKAEEKTIPISSKRTGQVPGTHIIDYKSPIDTITIKHEAHSRAGFAQGALLAAEWLVGKKGVFSMRDVLNIS
ncbi:4-hydroxy-tetrahydrodipicolinate reductase [Dokdonia sinensis]|uniref:4-hydroxy-tetrahydrodipicolinate reductase n=1 Tax=Dokdonia sinensis TaxID=2479847 RepID=A0A3M0GMM8_9FLAO|nr:4-hydroxy-tetrahydrodipicolinate reductase [Dokdonia sinensis]RMB63982.1 4-hydroxy-tetrahydrodipicolinate reductase [Dokdonia sinensis]